MPTLNLVNFIYTTCQNKLYHASGVSPNAARINVKYRFLGRLHWSILSHDSYTPPFLLLYSPLLPISFSFIVCYVSDLGLNGLIPCKNKMPCEMFVRFHRACSYCTHWCSVPLSHYYSYRKHVCIDLYWPQKIACSKLTTIATNNTGQCILWSIFTRQLDNQYLCTGTLQLFTGRDQRIY